MSHPSAREWGRAQAAKAPIWGDERWHRISRVLGVALVERGEEKERGEAGHGGEGMR